MKDKIFWLILLFASIYILGNIGTGSLSTWDEAIYANVSREILNTKNWFVLHHQGKPWFDKPPLYMWSTALFYKVFGVNEFSTRLTSGLFGIACIGLIYIYVSKIANKEAAIISSLMLLAMPHFIHFSKQGTMDVAISFFILLIIYLFWRGQERDEFLFASGLFIGIAYLMKGFAAFLAPMIIVMYALFSKNAGLLLNKKFLLGALIGFLIIFFWHLNLYFQCGPEAIKDYFGFHIIKRATQVVQEHSGGINYYQKVVFNKNKPWAAAAFLSLPYMLWLLIRKKDKSALLILIWVAIMYLFYSAVKTKLHWYIMPVYPALAFSTGILLARFFKNKAFSLLLIIILIGMLIQVPISWAFKLDFTPEVKKTANIAREVYLRGEKVYTYGASYAEMFYCSFAKSLNETSHKRIISEGDYDGYLVIQSQILEETSEIYNFNYFPIYESERLSLYKVKFIENGDL